MAIENFPAALQPIIQTGFLERSFQTGLRSRLGFRDIASKETFANGIGETVTKTRPGLKTPTVTPLTPSTNTNLDNGLTATGWAVEQYAMTINMFGDTMDLNMVTSRVGIVPQFGQNAYVSGVQAMQSVDRLARNALFYGNQTGLTGIGIGGYLGGNTRVRTTLGSAGTTVSVDDIRGFQFAVSAANGTQQAISSSFPLVVQFQGPAGTTYTCTGATADGSNVSTAPGGISGTLTFSANVAIIDGTLGNAVVATTAPVVVRPNGKLTTAALVAPTGQYGASNYVPGDTLNIQMLIGASALLQSNNVPPINGSYNCYLDNLQLAELFKDPDFKMLYRGAFGSDVYRTGQIFELVGIRFITTTENPQQATLGAGAIHRAIIVGEGALIEADFQGAGETDVPSDAIVNVVDGVVMVTRPPLDRLRQIIAQSWYWIGGFALPTDVTANPNIIPTATNSYLKRAIVLETL